MSPALKALRQHLLALAKTAIGVNELIVQHGTGVTLTENELRELVLRVVHLHRKLETLDFRVGEGHDPQAGDPVPEDES